MTTIQYDYLPRSEGGEGWGQIRGEKNANGDVLSSIEYHEPPPGSNEDIWVKEHRPDNSFREFRYHYSAFVKSITDFYGNPSEASIYYDPQGGGVSEVRFKDARQKTTIKTREPKFAATIRVTHPPSDSPPHESAYTETEYWDPERPHYVRYQWDERRNRTEYLRNPATDPNPNAVQRINYPDNTYETFLYNALGQVTDHKMRKGGTEKFTYDSRGLKQTYTPPATESADPPIPTQYFYYGGPSGPGEEPDSAGTTRPDLIDRLKRVIDPRGNSTWYEYNGRGQVTKVLHSGGTFTRSFYFPDGTLQRTEDELVHKTEYLYDEYKRVTEVKNHLDEIVTNSYAPWNGHGRLSHTTSSIYRVESHLGKKTDYDYDLNFRRIMMRQAPDTDDVATTWYHYDAVGNLDWMDDPRSFRTTYGYDERNRQRTVTNVSLAETTLIEYDPAGNKVKETRPDNIFRSWDYDSMNRLHHAYDWRDNEDPTPNQTTTYLRDDGGNIRSITDTKDAVYEFEYDDLNRKTKAKYPRTGPTSTPTETWHYDWAGNIQEYKNPAGQIRHFHHDNRNRQDHSWWTGSGVLGPEITTAYDPASRVTSITTNNGQTIVAFGYDHANRKLWEDQTVTAPPGGTTVTRRVKTVLDQDGRRSNLQITDPPAAGGDLVVSEEMSGSGSYSVTYDYTERNQLWHIYGGMGENWSFTYGYDDSGNMTSRQADYNLNTNITRCANGPNNDYDALNRARTWEQTGPNGFHALSHYQYDHANREEATWREEEGNRGERFTYEPTNQLATVVYSALNVAGPSPSPTAAARSVNYSYTPDKLNRGSMTETISGQASVVTNYAPNGLNQYTAVGGTAFTYDNNLNLTGTGGLLGTYNSANQLVAASSATETGATFVYDGLGRCVIRTVGGEATVFVFDGWKPIGEFDAWNNFQAWNVYGPGADEILLRQKDNMGYTFFLLDRHGNVSFLINNDGNLLEKYTYDVFGRPTITITESGEKVPSSWYTHNFLFQGREYLSQLGIYDYRNRFYHPETGRFLQIDPTGFDAGDMNLFRYCGDDPWNRSDPLGLENEIFGPGQQELAVDLARRHVEAANLDPGRKMVSARITTKGGGIRSVQYYPSKMVPVYHHGKGYQLGATVDGRPYTESGTTYELEKPKETGRRVAVLVHGHNNVKGGKKGDRPGIADAGWSSYDEKVRNIDRTDEANPGVWYSRRNGKEVPSDRASREKANRTSSGAGARSSNAVSGSSTDISSAPSAKDVDAAHQATGVPSLAAEAVNPGGGPP